jgi:hypothetical protein
VATRAVEGSDGFYAVVGAHRYRVPDGGSLGDANTFYGEWSLLGLSCLAAATLAALLPWIDDRLICKVAIALLVLDLAVVACLASVRMM